jgi:hypothetical protein
MSNKTSIDDFSKTVYSYVESYIEDIEQNVDDLTNDISKQATNELKTTSPKGNRGKYAKGWTMQKGERALKNHRYTIKIHNKTDYNLTHLLEFDHATRNGKRTRAIPHIRPVEDKYSKLYVNGITTVIRRNTKK